MSTSHLVSAETTTDHATHNASAPAALDRSTLNALRSEIEQLKVEDPEGFYTARFTGLAVERLLDTIDAQAASAPMSDGLRILGLLGVA